MRRLWVAIDRNGRVIPAMIHPIVPPKDLLETALSFLYLFIRPLVLISLLSPGPCFSMYRGKRDSALLRETMLLGIHSTPHPYTCRDASARNGSRISSPGLPFETRRRHRESVINFNGSRTTRIGIDIGDHGETTISN